MSESLLTIAEWLEASAAGVLVRESLWGFQIVVAIHILGLVLSVGTLVWFDLRLLGVSMPRVPVSAVYRRLMPWTLTGFVVMFVTGGLLLSGFATSAFVNTFFRIKMAAIAVAGVNALVYHTRTESGLAKWNESARPPLAAGAAGLISIVVWAAVILAGRMMSYTMF